MIQQVFVFENETRLWETCLQILTESVEWVAGTGHRPGVLAAGGSTFIPLYSKLGDMHSDVFLTDERMVSEGSGPDTGGMLRREWMDRLVDPDSRLIQVQRLADATQTAAQHDALLRQWVAGGGVFAVTLLGIGVDGHTASLFPGQREQWEGDERWYREAMPEQPPMVERVTGTPALFRQVIRDIVVLTGPQKIDIATRWLGNKERLPIDTFQPREERIILLDRLAARDLRPDSYELR